MSRINKREKLGQCVSKIRRKFAIHDRLRRLYREREFGVDWQITGLEARELLAGDVTTDDLEGLDEINSLLGEAAETASPQLSAAASTGGSPYFTALPYRSLADSPLDTADPTFYFEDFEDQSVDLPGVQITGNGVTVSSLRFSPEMFDSVDGPETESLWAAGSPGLTFSFDADALGGLPTEVGVVWTDGDGVIEFEAFDANGNSLGSLDPTEVTDESYLGTPDDDVFFGAKYAQGISGFRISNTVAGIEVDHVQFGGLTGNGVISGRKYADAIPATATVYGPTSYTSTADSPFDAIDSSSFYLEDFEDHELNTLGVAAIGENVDVSSATFPERLFDSVDEDDGVIDGQNNGGDSLWGQGNPGITFSFSADELGGLPTQAGFVWTDGAGFTSFEAFDVDGNLLGTIDPVLLADDTFEGTTADDHFMGIEFAGGIASMRVWNSFGGIEVDHLQYE